jgi:hypothetical protein
VLALASVFEEEVRFVRAEQASERPSEKGRDDEYWWEISRGRRVSAGDADAADFSDAGVAGAQGCGCRTFR